MRNNAPGGCGNDLAIDDISVSPCGPTIAVKGPTGTVCVGNYVSFNTSITAGYSPPYYQWQVSTDGGITYGDISGANAATYSINNVLASQNNNRYKVLVAGSADNVKNNSCAVQGNAVTLIVNSQSIVFNTPAAQCNSGGKLNLISFVNPVGGTFSGKGVTGSFLDPSMVSPGVDTLSYSYTSGTSGCTSTATAYVTIQPNPVVKITTTGPPKACYGSKILLSIGAGDYIQWYKNNKAISGATGTTYYADTTALYKVVVTSNGGCVGKDSTQVTIFPNQNLSLGGGSGNICSGDTATLKSSIVGSSYKWVINHSFVTSNTTNTYKATVANLYTLTVKDANGCLDSADFRVTVNPLPVVDSIQIGGDTIICKGNTVAFGIFNLPQYITFQWFKNGVPIPGATSNAYVATDSGTYFIQVTNIYGCKGNGRKLHVKITPNPVPPHVIASTPVAVCSPGTVTVQTSPLVPGLVYQWRLNGAALPNSNNYQYKAIGSGYYSVVVQNAKGCFSSSDSVKVTIYPKPSASVSHAGLTTCNGVGVPLTVNPSPNAGDSYQWYKNGAIATGQTGATYNTTGSGNYKYVITNISGCRDSSDSVTVNIYPASNPVIIADGPTTFCNPGVVTLESKSTFAGYQWYLSGVPITGATGQSYNATLTGSYFLSVVDNNGCPASSNALTVIANPPTVPLLTAGGPSTFCQGGSVALTASANPSIGTYAWFISGKGIPASQITSGGTQYVATQSGSYTVTFTNSNTCTATSLPLVVTVNPLPTPLIQVTGVAHFCDPKLGNPPSNFTLHLIKPVVGNTYTWTLVDTATYAATVVSGPAVNDSIYVVPPVLSSQGIYVVTEKTAAGCSGTSDSILINLYKPPVQGLSSLTICPGDTATLYSPRGLTFQWYYSTTGITGSFVQAHTVAGLGGIPDTNKTYRAIDSGYYYVNVFDGVCFENSKVIRVIGLRPIIVTVASPAPFCLGTTTNLNANVTSPAADPTGLTYNYQWYFMKSGGAVFIPVSGGIFNQVGADSSGTYKVIVSSKSRTYCPGLATATTTVSVPVKPVLAIVPKDTICAGGVDTIKITNQASILSIPAAPTYAWYRNRVVYPGHTADTLITPSSGSYYVIVTDGNGCPKPSDTVHIYSVPVPKPAITSSGPTRFCKGGSDNLSTANFTGYSYQWYSKPSPGGVYVAIPAASGGKGSSLVVIDSGYYKVMVTSFAGCSGIDSIYIRVDSLPKIVLPASLTLCPGTAQTLRVKTSASVQWSFNSVSNIISTADSIQANLPGTYYIKAKNTGNTNCYTLDSVKVTLYVSPVVDFYAPSNCQSSDTVTFNNSSKISDGSPVKYLWNFGDPASGLLDTSSSVTGKHIYLAIGKYTVKLLGISIHGCSDSATHVFNFTGTAPKAKFTVQGLGSHCSGSSVIIRDTSTIAKGKIARYRWDFFNPDGRAAKVSALVSDTVKDITALFPDSSATVIYRVRETVTSATGCPDTSSQNITITGFPKITFQNLLPQVCFNGAADTLKGGLPVSGSGGGIGAYSGTGVVSGIFYPSKAGPGKHPITYTFINPVTGCNGQAVDTINVLLPPSGVSLTAPGKINPCDTLVKLVASGTGVARYEWFRNDTLIANADSSIYLAGRGGKYTARLFNGAGCYTDTSVSFNLNPHPRANFEVASICQNLTVHFNNRSTIADSSVMTYAWNFGDPGSAQNTSTIKAPSHLYPSTGNYKVRLIASSKSGCKDTLTNLISVNPADSNANFTIVANKPYCLYESLIFEDSSYLPGKIIKQYTWKFYDQTGKLVKLDTGAVVPERFSITGNIPETFSAQEFLNTGDSCLVQTVLKKFTINPNTPLSYVREAPRDLCIYASPFNLTGGETVPPGQPGKGYYTGNGVDSASSTFYPGKAGIGEDQVSYVFTNQYGCVNSASVDYQVNDTIALTGSTIKANEGDVVTLNGIGALPFTFGPNGITSITADSLKWYWTPSTGLSSTSSPTPSFTAKQSITYTLSVTSPKGCVSHTEFVVNVVLTCFTPNAFSPNGDGINDTWHLKCVSQYPNAEVFIFNRWGEQLFYSKGYGTEFNGYYNGKPLPAGTYYYLIKYNQAGKAPQTGPLTIIY